jgi:adenine-specific DNA methylase
MHPMARGIRAERTLRNPFMGCGSTGLEAVRLGCETYAVDLIPNYHRL